MIGPASLGSLHSAAVKLKALAEERCVMYTSASRRRSIRRSGALPHKLMQGRLAAYVCQKTAALPVVPLCNNPVKKLPA